MEELDQMNQTGDMLQFVLPKNQSSYIKVMGVGGGGGNAVNHMYHEGIQGVDFIVCNTDAAALAKSPVPVKIQLGRGLGAGNNPDVARAAAMEKRDEIKEALGGTRMLFLTAGMGGGTGTGASPVVAAVAKEIELTEDEVKSILTVAIVTTPFLFEGRKRIEQAKAGIAALRESVDAILIIHNDRLRDYGKMTLMDAFAMADSVLTTAAKGISEIITVTSYVQIDFKDVNTVMNNSGAALMGFGTAAGENRANQAVADAMDSPLLNDRNIEGAKNILLYLSYGPDAPLDMDEIYAVTSAIRDRTGQGADMIWGAGEDKNLGANLNVTLIATGFSIKEAMGEHDVETVGTIDAFGNDKKRGTGNTFRLPANTEPAVELIDAKPAETAAKPNRIVFTLEDDIPAFNAAAPAATITETVAQAAPAPITEPDVNVDEEVEKWMSDIDVFGVLENEDMTQKEVGVQKETAAPMTIEFNLEAEEEFTISGVAQATAQATAQAAVQTVAQAVPAAVDTVDTVPPVTDTLGAMEVSRRPAAEVRAETLQSRCNSATERMRRLREMSQKMRTQQGLHELESVPAYMRQEAVMESITPSNVSEASHTGINADGNLFSTPPFLSEKAD